MSRSRDLFCVIVSDILYKLVFIPMSECFFFVVVVLRSTGTLVITLKDFQLVFNFSLLVYGKRFRGIFVVMILHLYYNMRVIPTFPFVRKSPVSVQ